MVKLQINFKVFKKVINSSLRYLSVLVVFLVVSVVGTTVSSSVVLAEQEFNGVRAEIIWVERSDANHRLMLSQLSIDEWSDSIDVYNSSNAITGPALGTSTNGDKLLIWTEQLKSRTVLKYMVRSASASWSEASIFTDTGSENFAASIIYDVNDSPWVFWSSARSGLSDIYMSRMEGSRWTKPVIVHALNEVPDIHPQASLNEYGEIHLKWTRYSFEQNNYIEDETIYEVVRRSDNPKPMIDLIDPMDIPLAKFLPDNRVAILHFPTNAMLQSRRISRSIVPN